jgi:hypothetical protein
MSIKVLSPKDDESKRLVDWIEGGTAAPLRAFCLVKI